LGKKKERKKKRKKDRSSIGLLQGGEKTITMKLNGKSEDSGVKGALK